MRHIIRSVSILFAVLTVAVLLKASLPPVVTGSWTSAGNMASAHDGGCSVLLPDGRILVGGGSDASGPTAKVDIFNTDGTWSAAAAMLSPRAHQSCAVLQSGQVLVAGGIATGGDVTNSAELYDPSADSWAQLPVMAEARSGATASVLQDGRVLIAGGQNSTGVSNTLEIYDPSTQNLSFAGTMSSARQNHAASLLGDGRVLIVGGSGVDANGNPIVLSSSDIYDPTSGTVSSGPTLNAARSGHSATTQLDGKVVVIGGSDSTNDLANIEVYDPTAGGNFSSVSASLTTARSGHLAFLLPNNNAVLVAGGQAGGNDLASAELYIPWSATTQSTGSMAVPRSQASGSPLSIADGLLLLAGGSSQPSTELYRFATVKTDQTDYAPGTTVTITGSGWQPGETVTLTSLESPLIDTPPTMTAVADANGNIFNNQFSPDSGDIDVRFYLTATGSQSQAQNTFTDSPGDSTSTTVSCSPSSITVNVTTTCTATVANTQSGAPNGYPRGGVTFTFNGTGTFSPAGGVCTVTQIGATNNSSCSVTLTPTAAISGNVKGNFNAFDNSWKNSTSPNFALTVVAAPTASLTASASTITNGSSVTLTPTFSNGTGVIDIGVGSVTNGVGVSVSPAVTMTYTLTVTNSLGATATSSVTVTVVPPPSISSFTASPSTINSASSSTLTAVFSGGSGSINQSVGAVTSGVGVSVSPASTTAYTLTVTNAAGTNTTAMATVTVNLCTPAAVVSSPQNQTVIYGQSATFSVTASGTAPLSYQWLKNGSPISGATSSLYSFNPVVGDSGSSFAAKVTNTCNGTQTATSSSAALTVNPASVAPSITAQPKVYDGMTTASISSCTVGPVVGTDDVACSVPVTSANFSDKNIGTGKAVSATGITLTGTTAPNYVLSATTATTTANITPRPMTVMATGVNKVYDGTVGATVTLSDNRVSGDSLTDSHTAATFADKNVGTSKSVTVTGISIAGADAANYALQDASTTTTADITPRSLTVTATGADRVYDGTTNATVTLSDNRVSGDSLADSCTSAIFASKNVGNESITVNGISISGTDAANYALQNTTAATSANITSLAVTVTAVTDSKVYDGTTSSSRFPAITPGLVGGDTPSFTQVFDTKNVGTGKTLTPSGSVNDGNGGNNYSMTFAPVLTGAITARPITVTAATDTKVYDGTVSSTGVPTITSGSLAIADTANFSQEFDSRNAGARTLTPSGSVNDGNSGNDYAVTFQTAAGSISARPITVTASPDSKVYDGTTTSSAVPTITTGALAVGDAPSLSQTFDNRNVGTGKTLTPSGSVSDGNNGQNYQASFAASSSGVITPRPITVTAVSDTKVYDGTPQSSGIPTSTSGTLAAGDIASFNQTFDSKNVGTGKMLTPAGSVSDGNSGNNYNVNFVPNTSGVITPKALTISGVTAVSRVYDAKTDVALNFAGTQLNGAIPGDSVMLNSSAAVGSFLDKNVGTNKLVTITGVTLSGNDAGNYTVAQPTGVTSSITPLAITGSITAANKVYDRTTSATTSGYALSGVLPDDSVAYSGGTATFSDPNAGNNKLVTAIGLYLSGTDAGNYTVNSTATANANITPAMTSTTVIASPSTSTLGQTVTLTATVSNTQTTPVPTGSAQFVVDGANFGSPVAIISGSASTTISTLAAGSHTITANYLNADGNFKDSSSQSVNEAVDYSFLGFFSPYQPPSAGVAYKIKSAIPLSWQYADVNGKVVVSSGASPQVLISGPYPCGGNDTLTEVLATSAGASGYQYDSTTNTWQFNWKTTGLQSGCYNIYVKSNLTSQQNGPYPIQLRN